MDTELTPRHPAPYHPVPQENRLKDPIWRLNNLYYVKNPKGEMPDKLKEQNAIIEAVYDHEPRKIVIQGRYAPQDLNVGPNETLLEMMNEARDNSSWLP